MSRVFSDLPCRLGDKGTIREPRLYVRARFAATSASAVWKVSFIIQLRTFAK